MTNPQDDDFRKHPDSPGRAGRTRDEDLETVQNQRRREEDTDQDFRTNEHLEDAAKSATQDNTVELSEAGSRTDESNSDKRTDRSALAITDPGAKLRGRKTSLPDHIAGYETQSRLGEGAFGIVLKCRDVKLDRAVAIKLQKINPLKSGDSVNRFLGEARAAGRLRHPHIVPVYEFGKFGGNQFIVYEFVDGETLDAWMRNHTNLRARIELIAKIAQALDYAHSLGIVHRDIKPANILIDHEYHQPHIADFGCAKYENTDELRTVDGSMMGTPAYMSPEVCDGFANQADGRADLWALGVILYEMLTDRRPFSGKYADLFLQIRSVEPKRPRQIDSAVPGDLEIITLKCMEKDKDRRFETCGQLADDLNNWLNDRPIQARKVSVVERTWLWSRRNPVVATLLGLVAGCLVLIALGSILFSIYSQRQNARIVAKQNEIIEGRIDRLDSASPLALPDIIADLVSLDPQSIKDVRERLASEQRGPLESFPFNLALYQFGKATSYVDEDALQGLADYVPDGSPEWHKTLLAIAGVDLAKHNPDFWAIAMDPSRPSKQRILASTILATTDPDSSNWPSQIDPVIEHLLAERAARVSGWARLLKPVSIRFKRDIENKFRSNDSSVRLRIAEIASSMFEDDIPYIVSLGLKAEPGQLKRFRNVLQGQNRDQLAKMLPNSAKLEDSGRSNLCLMQALTWIPGSTDQDVSPFETSMSTPIRHRLLNEMGPAGVDVEMLLQWIDPDSNLAMDKQRSPALAAVVLALGEYNQQQLSETRRTVAKDPLLQLFCEHRDVAVHSACRWLLNRWGFQKDLQASVSRIQTQRPLPGYHWHEDPIGVCFALFDPVESYTFGLGETTIVADIPRRFGIATHEFTRKQFADLENQLIHIHEQRAQKSPNDVESAGIFERIKQTRDNRTESEQTDAASEDAPVTYVTWVYVAWHCNGLSRRSGLPFDQNVYFAPEKKWDLVEANNGLDRLGYRMPTSREWEFACSAGVSTRFFFGDAADLFPAYGWSVNNSGNMRQSTGRLKPNDNGIFDIQGNVAEFCHNLIDVKGSNRGRREVRDQSCAEETSDINLFSRSDTLPRRAHERRGFRLARTYVSDPE